MSWKTRPTHLGRRQPAPRNSPVHLRNARHLVFAQPGEQVHADEAGTWIGGGRDGEGPAGRRGVGVACTGVEVDRAIGRRGEGPLVLDWRAGTSRTPVYQSGPCPLFASRA